jgi:hypothetical protein
MNNLAHIVLFFISLLYIKGMSFHNKSNLDIYSPIYLSHQKNIDLDLSKFKDIKIPFGNEKLASTTFPKTWKYADFSETILRAE